MKNISILLFLSFSIMLGSCKKQLEAKPDKRLLTPKKLSDLQSMMDYTRYAGVDPDVDECSADNYFLPEASYNGLYNDAYRNLYTWGSKLTPVIGNEWEAVYNKVYYCNITLETLNTIAQTVDNRADWNSLQGQALFKRGEAFFAAANIWSLPYDAATANTDLGIPLRLNTNFYERSVRGTVQQTYDQLINDLKAAVPLLPVTVIHPIRPSKPAAYAMLSRVFLAMRNYPAAKVYADSALALSGTLLDYNTINPGLSYSFSQTNPESIFLALSGNDILAVGTARIDTLLYASYASNDCRKTVFFRSRPGGLYSFKGSYANSDGQFSGLAVDELYLTRAECYARGNKINEAMADLNTLLVNRYKTGTFVPVTAADVADALVKILTERRKELVMRFTRWMDIRRLNKEGAGIVLKRIENGQSYELLPNSLSYALPLPEDVISISGMQQNPR